MKKMNFLVIAIAIIAVALCNSSCRNRRSSPPPMITYRNVPDGGTAVIDGGDLSGAGLLTNKATTTWIIRGRVKLADLSVIGKVIIDPGAVVEVTGLINVAGGAHFINQGQIICKDLTQVGDILLTGSSTTVTNQFTIGGGTTTYLQNSKLTVRDLRISGGITALENDATRNGNIYSVIYFSSGAYLNRGGGTHICGPVLFTYNGDVGGSGVAMTDVTTAALAAKPTLKSIYGLPDVTLYQYEDQGCPPLAIAPGF